MSNTKSVFCHKKVSENANKGVVHADTTYKLCWHRFPVLLCDTTNKYRKFHPFGIQVSRNERTCDFKLMFTALNVSLSHCFKFKEYPEFCSKFTNSYGKNEGWYSGFNSRTACTDNALEATKSQITEQYTNREVSS
jgi:hypothetical protein